MKTKEQIIKTILENSKQKILDLEEKAVNIHSYIDELKRQILEIEQNNYEFPKNIYAFANNYMSNERYECDICLEIFDWGYSAWLFNINNDWQNTKICHECTKVLAPELFEFCKIFDHYRKIEEKYEKIIGNFSDDLSNDQAKEYLEKIKNASSC
jgi:hypothetical protein